MSLKKEQAELCLTASYCISQAFRPAAWQWPTCFLLIDGWAKFKEDEQWRNSCAGTNRSAGSLID